MFQVLDNGKPAQYPDHTVDPSWKHSIFPTFQEALIYARKWLGPYGGSFNGKDGINLEVGIPWDYSGYGDTIEIREF